MEKNQNEELQSRREFFKKAAKGALPILGAVVLVGMPDITKAVTKTGCDYTCRVSCARDCIGNCRYACKTTCTGTCSGGCKTSCYYSSK